MCACERVCVCAEEWGDPSKPSSQIWWPDEVSDSAVTKCAVAVCHESCESV